LGHRKHSAPRRGSLAYRPRKRAQSFVPTVRNWPEIDDSSPTLLGFPCVKVGTMHAITVDDRERTPNFGKPFFNSASVLALPEGTVAGLRLYGHENGQFRALGEAYTKNLPEVMHRKSMDPVKFVTQWKEKLAMVKRLSAIVAIVPSEVGHPQKKPVIIEVGVGGGDVKSRFEYLSRLVGTKVKFADFFKPGMYVDMLGITKGKGFEGPVTRFGVKRKQHKSRKSVRAVGVIGPWHPAAVMYTVPRAGQRGLHQRTETGKRILLVGNAAQNPITPAGGFMHFGEVRGDYAIVKGSVPGTPRRVVVVRRAIRRAKRKVVVPQLVELSTVVRR
jgi:large subunit ribosomal protein L3